MRYHVRPVQILAVLLAAPMLASAGEVCGRVSVLGRDLPYGFVSLSGGPTERSMVRLEDGRFCIKDVAPGDYSVAVSPLASEDPMPLSCGGADACRVTVDAAGRPKGALSAEFAASKPGDDAVTIEGKVGYPKNAASAPSPTIVMIETRQVEGDPKPSYQFAWLDAGKEGSFEMRVAPGMIKNAVAWREGFAVASLDPSLHNRRTDNAIVVRTAQRFPLAFNMAPAGRISGQIRLADGKPFKPYLGAQAASRRWFDYWVMRPDNTQKFSVTTDEQGRYEVALAPGLWQFLPILHEGQGYLGTVRTGAQKIIWIAPGSSAVADYTLPAAASLKIAEGDVALEPLAPRPPSAYPAVSRWMLGFEEGGWDPKGGYRFFWSDEVPWGLAQGANGRWKIHDVDGDQSEELVYPVPAGRYDAFVFDSYRANAPYLVMRAVRKGVELKAGKPQGLALDKADYLPSGSAELKGSIKASMKWGPDDLKHPESISRFITMIAPFVNLYDDKGRLAGVATLLVSETMFHEFFNAADKGDMGAIRKKFYGAPREFRIAGLAPGRYRAQPVAFGYPLRDFPVELRNDGATLLDVDLDKD